MPKNVEFLRFVKEAASTNSDLQRSWPELLEDGLPDEFALDPVEVNRLLERSLEYGNGNRRLIKQEMASESDLQAAINRGESVCATALQQRHWESPKMRMACQSLVRSLGAPAVFAAVHMTPAKCWGSGEHADTGWTLVGQLENSKTWHLEPPLSATIDDFRAAHAPDDYFNGEHAAEPYVTLHPNDVLFIPSGWRHAAIAGEAPSVHISYGGPHPDVPLASVYKQD